MFRKNPHLSAFTGCESGHVSVCSITEHPCRLRVMLLDRLQQSHASLAPLVIMCCTAECAFDEGKFVQAHGDALAAPRDSVGSFNFESELPCQPLPVPAPRPASPFDTLLACLPDAAHSQHLTSYTTPASEPLESARSQDRVHTHKRSTRPWDTAASPCSSQNDAVAQPAQVLTCLCDPEKPFMMHL